MPEVNFLPQNKTKNKGGNNASFAIQEPTCSFPLNGPVSLLLGDFSKPKISYSKKNCHQVSKMMKIRIIVNDIRNFSNDFKSFKIQ